MPINHEGRCVIHTCGQLFETFNDIGPCGFQMTLWQVLGCVLGELLHHMQTGDLAAVGTKRLGDFRTLVLATTAAIIAMVGFGGTSAIWAVFVFLPIAALSDMAPPLLTAFAANRVGEDQQGLVQGVIASLSSVGAVAAPLAFTGVFEHFVEDTRTYFPGAPFLFAAVLIVVIVPLIRRLGRD